ncbi:hypothetical protein KVR01_012093 [Diaporthe batatas]|uniref:uncharacterized protein n=1 Tax=Diaporthe batatas TaxID=748121 RepID=UPI001D04DD3E|nr:uncharacterized protein KVR01_012093 [Diaporthe batatas]KAG8158332.1 hypothetical protein KVR01_012093 [Diaporthe batatas]
MTQMLSSRQTGPNIHSGTLMSGGTSTAYGVPTEKIPGEYLRANLIYADRVQTLPSNPHKHLTRARPIPRGQERSTSGQYFMQHNREHRQALWGEGMRVWKRAWGAARLHHSRRREFCCLEPGAGGTGSTRDTKGGSQATTWCCGGSQIFFFWRVEASRILAGPDIQSLDVTKGGDQCPGPWF